MTTQIANPYSVLGIPPTASDEQVREAYRRLAKQFHPDQNLDARANERMQRINRAWQMLSSPAARARYDALSAVPPPATYPHWGSARRSSPYATPPRTWAPYRAAYAAEARRDDDPGPLRWGLLLVAVPFAVLLTALFGALVPLPILGLILFFIARAVLGPRG
jgi:curved DNA-binding protein CbpA